MQPGDVVAERFELLHLAASGGTAAIFRARDLHSGGIVALKVAYGHRAHEAHRFAREAEYLARLDHPGIVRFIAHDATGPLSFIALEWLEGESLAARLRRVGLTAAETFAGIGMAADALAHAHARGIKHRDIKPENLFLVNGEAARVCVLDFGVAGSLEGPDTWDQIVGTPLYMSPEQLGGTPVDHRTDIFSLGCVMYECLTGTRPFAGETLMEIVTSVMIHQAAPVSGLPAALDAELNALLAQMLAKDPADRPPAGNVAAQLEHLGRRLEPRGPRTRGRATSFMSGERRPLCVGVVLCAPHAAPLQKRTVPVRELDHAELALATDVAASFATTVTSIQGIGLLLAPDARYVIADRVALLGRCALGLRQALPDLRIGIALRREVLEGRWQFGEVVAAATDLAEAATAEIRIDDVVADLLGASFETRAADEGRVLVRFFPGAGESISAQRDSRLVGREEEVQHILSCMHRCRSERQPHGAAVLGAAGLGKSRIARELWYRSSRLGSGLGVLVGRADPLAAGSPFAIAAQLVRSVLDTRVNDRPERQHEAIRKRVAALAVPAHVEKLEAYLGALIGLPPAESHASILAWPQRDPIMMADGLRWAFCEWLRAECSRRELLILVLEDMHWGDFPSIRVLHHALAVLRGSPLFVLVLSRPEGSDHFPEIFRSPQLDLIHLTGLGDRDAETLVRERLDVTVDDGVVAQVVARAGGNPLYLNELAIRAASSDAAIPETVLTTAQANLERLEPFARRLLRAASLFGDVFWASGIVALMGQWNADEVARQLYRLERDGIIDRRHDPTTDELAYAFHHSLLREAAYAMLADADRPTCHRLVAEWSEQYRSANALALAEHWVRADAPARAVEWYLRAAEQAISGNDFAGTLDYSERAVRCGARGELLGKLRLLAAEAHEWAGDQAKRAAAAEEALANLRVGSGLWLSALLQALHARLIVEGVYAVAALAAELEEFRAEGRPSADEIIVLARVSGYLTMYGEPEQGRRFFDRSELRAKLLGGPDPRVEAWLAWARAWQALTSADLVGALEYDVASANAFEIAGDLRQLCYARSNVGYEQMRLGLFIEARTTLEATFETARALDLRLVASTCAHNLGMVLGHLGELDRALEVQGQAKRLLLQMQSGRGYACTEEYLARIYVMRGEIDRAEECARRALELSCDWPTIVAQCSASLAFVLLHKGDIQGACDEASRAIELLEMNGSPDGEEFFIRCAHAECMERAGRRAEARAAAAAAVAKLMANAARIDNERIRHAFLSGVPEHRRLIALDGGAHA